MSSVIVTPRLELRSFADADLDAFVAYRREPDVARYQSWSPDFTEEAGRAFIAQVKDVTLGTPGAWVNIAVERRGMNAPIIGDVALFVEADSTSGKLGFTFASEHQGHGYAREAAGAVVEHVLNVLGVPLLCAITDARNARSIHLLESLGFRNAGFDARGVLFKGEPCDELRFERRRA